MELNDDVLMIIFKGLNIRDQISIARVCVRFRAIMTSLWSRKYLHFTDSSIRHILYPEFSVLMRCISPFVHSMDLQDLTFERFQVLKRYRYPKLASFTFCRYPSTFKDENILDMTKMFPALKSFTPVGAFSGKYMENFRHLEHLDLFNCDKKKFNCLQTIFERSHIKSLNLNVFRKFHKWTSRRAFKNFCDLEKLSVNSFELKWLSNLRQFSKLKELIVEDRDKDSPFRELLLNLHEYKHNDIIELETSIPFPFCVPPTDVFENLRKLTINYRNITDFTDVGDNAPNLREIVFNDCEIWSEGDLRSLFAESAQLEYISIEQCHCAFREFNIDAEDIVRKRTTLLHFNFHDNTFLDLDDEFDIPFLSYIDTKLNVSGSSDFLKISDESSDSRNYTLRVRFQ